VIHNTSGIASEVLHKSSPGLPLNLYPVVARYETITNYYRDILP